MVPKNIPVCAKSRETLSPRTLMSAAEVSTGDRVGAERPNYKLGILKMYYHCAQNSGLLNKAVADIQMLSQKSGIRPHWISGF
jgi:hypothetical protein